MRDEDKHWTVPAGELSRISRRYATGLEDAFAGHGLKSNSYHPAQMQGACASHPAAQMELGHSDDQLAGPKGSRHLTSHETR